MSNLKKLLAVIITVCMLATFAIPAVAESDLDDWEICEELGIIKGTGAGVTDDYLASTPLRYQGAILFLRLLGLEDEAYDFDGDENFDDADQVNAKNQALLAYLKANPDLGFVGVGDNKFAPLQAMTAKQYYKVLLTALGYKQGEDYEWANVLSFAAGLGLYKLIDVENFTIEALCIGTVEALKADVKDSDATLLATLVDAGVIDGELAEELGLYEVPVVALAIESAVGLNYREIVVTFNKAVDAAKLGKADNYRVDGEEVEAVEAADNNLSVLILVKAANAIQTGKEAEVEVKKDILGADVKVKTAPITDGSLPYIVSAEAIGNSVIKVTFSEPVKNIGGPADYKLDGLFFGQNPLPAVAGRVITLSPTDRMAAGEREISVYGGIQDYAGYNLTAVRTVKFTVDEDTTPPTVSFVSATQKEVTVEFSEAVVKTTIEAATIGFSPAAGDATAALKGDGKTLVVSVTGAFPASGTTTMTIPKAAVVDTYGNSPEADLTVSFQATADTDRPAVTSVAFDEKDQAKLYVTFDKAVALTGGAIEVTQVKDGKSTDVDTVLGYVVVDGKEVKTKLLVTRNPAAKYDPAVTYTVVVKNFTDAPNPLENKMIDYVISGLTVKDLTPPAKVGDVLAYGRSLFINFDDAVDSSTVVGGNFAYSTGSGANTKLYYVLPSAVTVGLINSNKTIKITWPDSGDYAATTNEVNFIQYTGLKGADGNAIAGAYIPAPWTAAPVGPALGTASVTGAKTVVAKLTSADNLIFDVSKALADFELVSTSLGGKKYNLINASYDTTKKEITFTTYESFASDGTIDGYKVDLKTKASTSLADIFGQKIGASATAAVADKFAPTASVKTGDGAKEIKVTFTEAIDISGGSCETDIIVRKGGALLTLTGDKFNFGGVDTNVTTIVITVPESAVEYTVEILSRLGKDKSPAENVLKDLAPTKVTSK